MPLPHYSQPVHIDTAKDRLFVNPVQLLPREQPAQKDQITIKDLNTLSADDLQAFIDLLTHYRDKKRSKTLIEPSMSKRSGLIFETNDGDFAIAIHAEQKPEFAKVNKVYVHFYSDNLCTKPLDKKPSLKSLSLLKMVGFSD